MNWNTGPIDVTEVHILIRSGTGNYCLAFVDEEKVIWTGGYQFPRSNIVHWIRFSDILNMLESDICAWSYDYPETPSLSPSHTYTTSCGNCAPSRSPMNTSIGWLYCPFCGKKIELSP